MGGSLAIAGGEPGGGVVELHTDGGAFDGVAGIERATGVHVAAAIGFGESPEGESSGDFLLVGGMDIRDFADIRNDGHSGMRDAQALALRLPELGQDFGVFLSILERGDLNEVERQFGLLESGAPRSQQGFLFIRVDKALIVIGLALIPNGTPNCEGHQGMDHGVVKRGGGACTGIKSGWLGGERGYGLFVLQGRAGCLRPGFDSGEVLLLFAAVGGTAWELGLDISGKLLQLRHLIEARLARPRFNASAAPGALNDADWNIELRMQFESKVVTDGREAGDTLGSAGRPESGNVVLWGERNRFGDLDDTQIRMCGVRNVGFGIRLHLHFPFHVGLP